MAHEMTVVNPGEYLVTVVGDTVNVWSIASDGQITPFPATVSVAYAEEYLISTASTGEQQVWLVGPTAGVTTYPPP